MMGNITISANRVLYVFRAEELLYLAVNVEKKNSCDIVLTHDRRITVHESVSKLYDSLSKEMAGKLYKVSRDACVNIDAIYQLGCDGCLKLIDHDNPHRGYKFFIPGKKTIAELMNKLMQ